MFDGETRPYVVVGGQVMTQKEYSDLMNGIEIEEETKDLGNDDTPML